MYVWMTSFIHAPRVSTNDKKKEKKNWLRSFPSLRRNFYMYNTNFSQKYALYFWDYENTWKLVESFIKLIKLIVEYKWVNVQ